MDSLGGTLNGDLPSTFDSINGVEYLITSDTNEDNATLSIQAFDVATGTNFYIASSLLNINNDLIIDLIYRKTSVESR